MIVVSKDLFQGLKIPLNQGLFGANKTLRGVIVVPIFTSLGFWSLWPVEQWLVSNGMQPIVSQHNLFLIGLVSGLLYVLAELPNSFLKRRMGAAPGETPQRFQAGFILLDQIDSALLIAIGYGVFFDYHWTICVAAFVLAPLVALSVKRVLFAAKLKKTAT
jgi:CDP-diacylglycerol--serine O-phosphatidyltransferase